MVNNDAACDLMWLRYPSALRRTIKEQSLAVAIKTVKQTARSVPVWLTLIAWSMVFVALALHTVKFRPGP